MIEINLKQSIGVTGEAVIGKRGEKPMRQKNTVTNIGLSEIVYSLIDKSAPAFYFAVGDDDSNITPAQVALQNALANELERIDTTKSEVYQDGADLNYIYRVTGQFGGSPQSPLNADPAVTLKELGLFNRYIEGEMFARAQTDAPFTMDSQSIYTASWQIKLNVQDIITSGGIVFSGSKLVCDAIMKIDKEVDNVAQYYEGKGNNTAFTLAPFGLNLVSLGGSANTITQEATDLVDPRKAYDTPPTITRLDLTGEVSDINYEAKIIIQKYIPANTVPFIVKEAGLFNSRHRRAGVETNLIETLRTMFSRVVLPVPIPANSEATLTWVISFKRGA
jgi:hypothetical protein